MKNILKLFLFASAILASGTGILAVELKNDTGFTFNSGTIESDDPMATVNPPFIRPEHQLLPGGTTSLGVFKEGLPNNIKLRRSDNKEITIHNVVVGKNSKPLTLDEWGSDSLTLTVDTPKVGVQKYTDRWLP